MLVITQVAEAAVVVAPFNIERIKRIIFSWVGLISKLLVLRSIFLFILFTARFVLDTWHKTYSPSSSCLPSITDGSNYHWVSLWEFTLLRNLACTGVVIILNVQPFRQQHCCRYCNEAWWHFLFHCRMHQSMFLYLQLLAMFSNLLQIKQFTEIMHKHLKRIASICWPSILDAIICCSWQCFLYVAVVKHESVRHLLKKLLCYQRTNFTVLGTSFANCFLSVCSDCLCFICFL